jgi:chromosome segregation ATPase
MSLTKNRHRTFGALVGFGISFGLSLIILQNPLTSFINGVVTFSGSFLAVGISDRQRIKREKKVKNSFQHQIKRLEAEENQLYQSLSSVSNIKEQVESKVNSLYLERTHLLNRIAELNFKRNDLYRDVNHLQQQLDQITQAITQKKIQIEQLEKREIELNQAILRKSYNSHPSQRRINQLKEKVAEVQTTLTVQEQQQQKIEQELINLETYKQEIEGNIYDLNGQIKLLEYKKEGLETSISELQNQKQTLETTLEKYHQETHKLQNSIETKTLQQEEIKQAILELENHKQELEIQLYPVSQIAVLETPLVEIPHLITNFLPLEWQEWLNFVQQLSPDERKAFKAILEKDAATLKQIADQQITMPEVIIDLLNDNALKLIGDTPFTRNDTSIIPEVHQEYIPILIEPINLNFKDLLNDHDSKKADI